MSQINDANGIHLFQNGHNYGYTNGYVDVPLGEMPIRQDYSPSNKFTDLTQDQYNTLKHNASRLEYYFCLLKITLLEMTLK